MQPLRHIGLTEEQTEMPCQYYYYYYYYYYFNPR